MARGYCLLQERTPKKQKTAVSCVKSCVFLLSISSHVAVPGLAWSGAFESVGRVDFEPFEVCS